LTVERHAHGLPRVDDPFELHALPGSGGLVGLGQTLLHAEGIVKLFENACGAVDVSGLGGER